MKDRNGTHGISPARMGGMARLVNDLGRCLTLNYDTDRNGNLLQQGDCKPTSKWLLWSWNNVSLGSGDKHLCNGHGKCASVRVNNSPGPDMFQWDYLDGAEGQRFDFLESKLARPGFYLIKNINGKCISVPGNSDRNGAKVYGRDCNASEPGQNWKWNHMY